MNKTYIKPIASVIEIEQEELLCESQEEIRFSRNQWATHYGDDDEEDEVL